MMQEPAVKFGRLSETADCPVYEKPECYEPCWHTNRCYEEYGRPPAGPVIAAHTDAILSTAEEWIAAICAWEPDLCQIGDILGFPCVQCGLVVSKAFALCASEKIECGGNCWITIDPCASICDANLCDTDCAQRNVDLSVEYPDFYADAIDALKTFDGEANRLGIDQMVKLLIPDSSGVVAFKNGTYYLDIGGFTSDELLVIINKLIPLPIGAALKWVKLCS